MSAIEQTYDQIVRYLKDLLSNRERHDLEKKIMRDTFDEEAFEGLNQLSVGELETDMDTLINRLDERIQPRKKRNLVVFYRIAAAVLLLIGIGSMLYVVFRPPSQHLITQETRRTIKQAPVSTAPAESQEPPRTVPEKSDEIKESVQQVPGITENQTKSVAAEKPDVVTVETVEINDMTMEEPEAAPEATATVPQAAPEQEYNDAPEPARKKKSEKIAIRGVSSNEPTSVLSAKVVDSQGLPLPGVNILVKGTSRGTVTDIDGNFTLQVPDANPILDLSFVGYKSLELNGREVSGKEIALTEDLVALDEVVVIGYGTQKKNEVTGAVSRVESRDISTAGEYSPYNYIKPVPPGGTLKAFEKWVEEQIDDKQFTDFPGKHRIQISLTVHTDGSIANIKVKNDVPAVFAEEYKRIIAQSPLWKTALKNNVPVEAEVMIRFVATVEEKK